MRHPSEAKVEYLMGLRTTGNTSVCVYKNDTPSPLWHQRLCDKSFKSVGLDIKI